MDEIFGTKKVNNLAVVDAWPLRAKVINSHSIHCR